MANEITAALLRAALERSHEAVALLRADGSIHYLSPGAARLLGYPPGTFEGRDPFTPVHPDDMEQARAAFARLLEAPGASSLWEVRVRHQDGTWRHIEVEATNLLHDPEVGLVVANYRDVGARVIFEQEHAARLRLEGAMLVARTVAHRVNNALAPVSGFSELLTLHEAVRRDPTLESYGRLIHQGAQEVADLVARLLQIVRLEEDVTSLGPDHPMLDLDRCTAPDGPAAPVPPAPAPPAQAASLTLSPSPPSER